MSEHELALSLKDVGVSYRQNFLGTKKFWALRDISFDLLKGENLGVIGQNGSGKSTLLRLLSGIYAPDEGVVDNYGNRASLLSLQVGFLPHLDGRHNAVLSGMLLGKSREEMLDMLPEIIDYSGLEKSINNPLRTYSSGMKARLGFAVSHFADADILLVDEVLGVGDTAFREKSAQTMRARIASNNSVVLVSHNPRMIRALCSRVAWLEFGKLRAIGDISLLDEYEQYVRKNKLKL